MGIFFNKTGKINIICNFNNSRTQIIILPLVIGSLLFHSKSLPAQVRLTENQVAPLKTAIFDEFTPDKRQLFPSILTPIEAQTLFDSFKKIPNISFDYPPEGCYAKATAMALHAEKMGVQVAKIHAEGRLRFRTNHIKGLERFDPVVWGWHVAPVLYVKSKNGEVDIQVFDPAMAKTPVSVQEWKLLMNGNKEGDLPAQINKIYFSSKFQLYGLTEEKVKTKWQAEDLKKTFDNLELYSLIKKPNPAPAKIRKILKKMESPSGTN